MHPRFTGLWRHRDFVSLWTGQTISVFGSMVGGAAMSFTAILTLHATPSQMGGLAAARLLPGFLVGLMAGVWVDRLRRRPIMIAADFGRAVALATIPLAALFHALTMALVYVVAFVVSILTLFFDVAYQSYLPTLVTSEELIEGNSKLTASAAVAEFGGFGVAGWLVQVFTAPIAILLDALSFVCSAVFVGRIGDIETPPPRTEQEGMRHEIVEGLHTVARNPVLRASAACVFSQNLFGGIYGALVVLYMSRGLGFQPGILTMFWAVGGLSSFFGAVAATRATARFGIGPAMIVGLLLWGISMLFIPLAQGATLVSALLLIAQQLTGDGGATIYEINLVSLRQTIAPERLLGRVNASVQFLGTGAMLSGALLGGWLGEGIGVRAALVVGGVGTLLSTLWLVFSPIRGLHIAESEVVLSEG